MLSRAPEQVVIHLIITFSLFSVRLWLYNPRIWTRPSPYWAVKGLKSRPLFWKPGDTWHSVCFDTWTDAKGISCQRQIRTCRAAKFCVVRQTVYFSFRSFPDCLTPLNSPSLSLCAPFTHTPPFFLAQRWALDAPARTGKGTDLDKGAQIRTAGEREDI